MAKSRGQEFLNLLEEIFSVPCISIASDPSITSTTSLAPSASGTRAISSNEYRTTSLLLLEARSASLSQLVELLLQLLLSNPPFTHTLPELLTGHQSHFFTIWDQDCDPCSSTGDISGDSSEQGMPPQQSLNILTDLRLSFQNLKEEGFKFVSELLFSCIRRLSPEAGGSRRNWVVAHGKAVNILSELLYSVPGEDWLRLDTHSEYATAVWRCLQILTSGAVWWGKESKVFERNLERLSRCFFKLPIASSLLRAALRVDLAPAEIHSTVTTLLVLLEHLHGFSVSENVNAFTPTPFNFPVSSALERHVFSKPYEFANLRVLFVSWINADAVHRRLGEFRAPWSIDIILQHTEAYKRLKMHPESAARVSLGYIFNEVQLGREGFKPSTDMKAIELLKVFIAYRYAGCPGSTLSSPSPSTHLTTMGKAESRPEACIIMNAEWVLPWMWWRRNTDLDFVMVVTSAWMLALCGDTEELTVENPLFGVLEKNYIVLDVFSGFFRHVFLYDFISNSVDQRATLIRVCRLMSITLQAIQLMFTSRPQETSQGLCIQIIQCFVASVDQEWIPASCWALVCELFAKAPRLVLTEAFASAYTLDSMDLFIPIFLREIETVTGYCGNYSVVSLPVDPLATHLESLTVMFQFVILAAGVNNDIRHSFAKKSHFISSILKYVNQDYKYLLLGSSRPELVWIHAASVGAACEILVATGFGVDMTPGINIKENINIPITRGMTEQMRNQEVLRLILRLVGHKFEMSYVISPLCGLVAMLNIDWWVKKPFIYFDVFGYIRMVLLQNGTHKWCCLVPVFVHAVAALLRVDAPIRQMLVENRWNLDLVVAMLTRIRDDDVHCGDCGVCFRGPILRLVTMLVERRPAWYRNLLLGGGMGRYSMLTIEALEGMFETQLEHLYEKKQMEEDSRELAEMVVRIVGAFPEWEVKASGMRRRLERARIVAGERGVCVGSRVYGVYRPIKGVPFCLVPG